MDRQFYLSLESRADAIRRRLHCSIDAMSDDAIIRLERNRAPSEVFADPGLPPSCAINEAEGLPTLRFHQLSA